MPAGAAAPEVGLADRVVGLLQNGRAEEAAAFLEKPENAPAISGNPAGLDAICIAEYSAAEALAQGNAKGAVRVSAAPDTATGAWPTAHPGNARAIHARSPPR